MRSNSYSQSLIERMDVLSNDSTMQRIAMHHIYEYEKGIRYMVLCTLSAEDCAVVVSKLEARAIDYYTKPTPGGANINLFFGRKSCVDMMRLFLADCDLHELDDERDFIVGAMLGYDVCGQCERYHGRRACLAMSETVA